jgi:glycosyltransferase involved in cell wall biosynthesis
MRNRIPPYNQGIISVPALATQTNFRSAVATNLLSKVAEKLPEILFITSFPPRECGIATYSQDLIKSLKNKFRNSFNIKICALESENEKHLYSDPIKYTLNTDQPNDFKNLANKINANDAIQTVLIQHEFGLFRKREQELREFMEMLLKPVVIVFHTILPNANDFHKAHVQDISRLAHSVIVMTNSAATILEDDYGINPEKINVIAHGTHLVAHNDKTLLKEKYSLSNRKILSTFGLINSGKSIETTLDAMPSIIKENSDALFLIIGKTHPSVSKEEGEKYREMLEEKIKTLQLENHVLFINSFLPLPQLLEFLQLTDIYLFTSKDPNQAVSGTFSYALSSGCPIISTPIPHAREVLKSGAGVIIDFENSEQLSLEVNRLLANEELRNKMSSKGLHKMASAAWENSAIAHAKLFEKMGDSNLTLKYRIPEINLDHLKKMTTHFGIIQFSIINQPDINSGYTLDDNARAMVAMCEHYQLYKDKTDLGYIKIYLDFIKYCLQNDGKFLNYVDEEGNFTDQNNETNLEDSNGRAIWALGYLISLGDILPVSLVEKAQLILIRKLPNLPLIHSTRAMAFIIKGLYYATIKEKSPEMTKLAKELANRIVQMHKHESSSNWAWYENYLTYGNSILPESMLCAFLMTGDTTYKEIAKTSFDFLLSIIFRDNRIKVISNKGWLLKENANQSEVVGGEQAIDVAYTIMALSKFAVAFKDSDYTEKMKTAFSWFLGNNHLNQIIYNPCTGGCYDGLEETYVNLNQGAESTVSYLMARLAMEKYKRRSAKPYMTEGNKEFYIKLNYKNELAE